MEVFEELNNILLTSENPSKEIENIMGKEVFINSDFNILNELKNVPQDKKFHPEGNVWNHTKLVVDMACKVKEFSISSKTFMWAALFHDIGKITTTKFIKGRYRSYNHDKEGENVTYNILIKYMDEDEVKKISEIVSFHMHHIYILKDLPFSNVPGLIKSSNYNDIVMLFICDKLGRGNQGLEEKKKALNEVNTILDKLEKENSEVNNEVIKKVEKIKNILIK